MRLGHAGEKTLQTLVNQGVFKGTTTGKIDFCEHCIFGKKKKNVFDYVHTDVWGPTKNVSLEEKRWFVTFIDDYSRRVWMYLMRHKGKVLEIFLEWKKMVENQTDRKIKKLRSDNRAEFFALNLMSS